VTTPQIRRREHQEIETFIDEEALVLDKYMRNESLFGSQGFQSQIRIGFPSARRPIKAGFELVCSHIEIMLFRKRK
jgi:hypothetical protein